MILGGKSNVQFVKDLLSGGSVSGSFTVKWNYYAKQRHIETRKGNSREKTTKFDCLYTSKTNVTNFHNKTDRQTQCGSK